MTDVFSAQRTFYTGAISVPADQAEDHDAVASPLYTPTQQDPPPAQLIEAIPPRPIPIIARPIVAPVITQTSAGVLGPNPILGVVRPIGIGWPTRLPLPRSRYALPTLISPSPSPNSQTLFEEPQDGTKKHYVQPYAIATQGTAAQPLYWVSLAPTGQDFTLTVHLATAPFPGAPIGATPVTPTAVSYILSATLLGRIVTWDLTTTTPANGTLTLTTVVTGLPARDTLYHAMTDTAAGAQLIVRSAFAIASLVSAAPTAPPQQPTYRLGPGTIDLSIPFTFDPVLDQNIFSQITNVGTAGPTTWSHKEIVWNERTYSYYFDPSDTTHALYLPDSFKISRQDAAPHAPSLQIVMTGSDPSSQSFVLSFLAEPVTSLARLQDAAGKLISQLGFPSGVQLAPFEASKASLALTLPASDGTSAPGLQTVAGATIDVAAGISGAVTLTPQQLQQVYSALFEGVSMLLSGVVTVTINPTDTTAPTIPFIARADDFAGDIFTIATSVTPFVNQFNAVLTNAIESPIRITGLPVALQKNGTPVTSTFHQMSVNPPVDLIVGGVAPTTDGSGGGGGNDGNGSGTGVDTGNLGGLLGGFLGGSGGGAAGGSGTGGAGFGNGGGGGLLGGFLGGIGKDTSSSSQAAIKAPASDPVTAPSPTAPPPAVPTAPSLNVTFNLPQGGTSSDVWTVLADYSGSQVQPDQSAIWDAIMSSQVLSPFNRMVSIQALTLLFQPPPTPAAGTTAPQAIIAVQVVFSSGETANFNASTAASGGVMTQTVSLSVPLKDYILQTGDTSSYNYRVDLITATGTTTGQWMASNQDSIFVQANG